MIQKNITACFASIALLALILDTKTALGGASEGIELCMQTVIPSLFAFIFLSILLTNALSGQPLAVLRPLCRVLNIPKGAESLLLIGLVGGYPVGAQCVADARRTGTISAKCARRLLAFCSNAGPSFIFGIGSHLFTDRWMCWALWAIHIFSAIIVGCLVQGADEPFNQNTKNASSSVTQALPKATRAIGIICGWVVIFRVLIAFCKRWFLWMLPGWLQCLFCGVIELTNGCCSLAQIADPKMRFILYAMFLGFGGVCVTMQTYSVTEGADASLYLPGKILQAVISTLLAGAIISREIRPYCICVLVILFTAIYFSRKKLQKRIAFRVLALYNSTKFRRR